MLDKILIKSKFMKGVISKLVERSIKKNKGVDTNVKFNYLNVDTSENDYISIKVDGEIKMRKEDFLKILFENEEL